MRLCDVFFGPVQPSLGLPGDAAVPRSAMYFRPSVQPRRNRGSHAYSRGPAALSLMAISKARAVPAVVLRCFALFGPFSLTVGGPAPIELGSEGYPGIPGIPRFPHFKTYINTAPSRPNTLFGFVSFTSIYTFCHISPHS